MDKNLSEARAMSTIVSGIVTNGVVVPSAPLPEGARVEIQVTSAHPAVADDEREKARAAALDHFQALARSSTFRSTGPYPTRDELHERR
jgi:hypothetical protein